MSKDKPKRMTKKASGSFTTMGKHDPNKNIIDLASELIEKYSNSSSSF